MGYLLNGIVVLSEYILMAQSGKVKVKTVQKVTVQFSEGSVCRQCPPGRQFRGHCRIEMRKEMKKAAFHNLGCKVNAYELEVMQQKLQEKGYEIVPFEEAADVYVINTCTVTNIADRKSRQMLHRAKQRNPEAVVVAVGCYVQADPDGIQRDDCVDLAIGNNKKGAIAEILEQYLAERPKGPDKTLGGTTVVDIAHAGQYETMQLKQTAEHTRAYIKIQDGCNQFCSYCAIPLARGRVRSRRPEEILTEIRELVAKGYQEVVLTGIHISSYGMDFDTGKGEDALIGLTEQIQEIEGLKRLRLGSLEPRIVTEDAVRRLAALPKLCPHFHLSLQSGCDDTLKRMNRRYTAGEYYERVELLRGAFAHPAITTDVIVGFPGETEEEFEQSKAFLEKVGFYEMHIFKYSPRKGTAAARMPDQIPAPVKAGRSDVLFELERRQSREFRSYYIGREAEILWEEKKIIQGRAYLSGHTRDYVKVAAPCKDGAAEQGIGRIFTVPVKDFLTEEILLA